MFDVLHGLRGKILALCLGSLTLLGLTMGAAGVYAVVQAAEAVQPDVRATVFQLITIFVWCLLISAFVSLILTTRLAQSLDELMDAAKMIGAGDLDVRSAARAATNSWCCCRTRRQQRRTTS